MKVKNIYFIHQCPGLPVYEMQDGKLMMPFSKKGDGKANVAFFWTTEDQITKGVSDQKILIQLRSPFRIAELEISKINNTIIDDIAKTNLRVIN